MKWEGGDIMLQIKNGRNDTHIAPVLPEVIMGTRAVDLPCSRSAHKR